MIQFLSAALILFSVFRAGAVELYFGPEFTFAATNGFDLVKYCNHLKNHLVINQPAGERFTFKTTTWGQRYNPRLMRAPLPGDDKLYSCQFTSPEGWSFMAKVDTGVIEVTMSPLTVQQARQFASNIQDAIFVSAYNTGHFPQLFSGGGHINVSIVDLEKRPLHLRNFIVDFLNHNELSLGVFGYDTNNAIAFDLLDYRTQSAITAEFEKFDQGDYDIGPSPVMSAQLLLNNIDKQLDVSRDPYYAMWNYNTADLQMAYNSRESLAGTGRSDKEHAMSFFWTRSSLEDHLRRIEIRVFRPQADYYTFLKQIELLQARVDYIGTLRSEIIYNPNVEVPIEKLNDLETTQLTPPVNPQDALRSFYLYVTESGLKWSDHRDYIWPMWISGGELQKFESSEWYKEHEQKVCGELLR